MLFRSFLMHRPSKVQGWSISHYKYWNNYFVLDFTISICFVTRLRTRLFSGSLTNNFTIIFPYLSRAVPCWHRPRFPMENGEIRPLTESKTLHCSIWHCEYMITSGSYALISTFVKNQFNFLVIVVRPVDRCSCAVAQKTLNHPGMCLLVVRTQYFHISTLRNPHKYQNCDF